MHSTFGWSTSLEDRSRRPFFNYKKLKKKSLPTAERAPSSNESDMATHSLPPQNTGFIIIRIQSIQSSVSLYTKLYKTIKKGLTIIPSSLF